MRDVGEYLVALRATLVFFLNSNHNTLSWFFTVPTSHFHLLLLVMAIKLLTTKKIKLQKINYKKINYKKLNYKK